MTSRIEPDGMHATVEVIGDAPLSEHAVVRCARQPRSQSEGEGDPSDKSGGKSGTKSGGWRVEPELPDVLTLPKRTDAPSPPPPQ